jgi:dTDP-4-amino-4,6-dideoxygalactose transaminase
MSKLTYAEWRLDEYLAVGRALFGRTARGSATNRLVAAVEPMLAGRTILPVNRGRTALAVALEAFGSMRPGRGEIIVPAYICPSVTDTVRSCGFQPVPADIGPDLNIAPDAIRSAVTDRTLAVIAAHMYACPVRIAEVEALCRALGIFLVDDAAQVIGVDSEERPLGTFGDAGLVSFSQSKTIVAGAYNCGGLLIVNDESLVDRMRQSWQALDAGVYQMRDLLTFLWDYQLERVTEVPTYLAGRLLRRLRLGRARGLEGRRRMAEPSAAVALAQLKTLAARVEGRKRVARRFHERLASRGIVRLPQYAPDRYLARIIVLLPEDVTLEPIRTRLKRGGVQTRRGYAVDPASAAGGATNALAVAGRLLELPSCSQMADATIDRICSLLDDAISAEVAAVGRRIVPASA